MKTLAIVTLAGVLTACAGMGAREPQRYYVLEAEPPAPRLVAAQCTTGTLLVSPTTSVGFYDTQAIVYSRQPGMRAYYQLNSWTEPPSRRLGGMLTERLARSGAFCTVAGATDGVRGTLLLSTQLEQIYHDVATSPGTANISLTAVLSDPAKRVIVARRKFVRSAPVATADAAGAVQGFDLALGPLLDEVVAWAADSAPTQTAE